MLVKASLDAGAWWLAAAILVSGLLTTVAFGRVFLLAFWRAEAPTRAPRPKAARLTFLRGAGGAATVPSLMIGLYPEPFIAATAKAAAGLIDPSRLYRAVFPGAAP